MYNPTTRLLTVLELLQARGRIGGAELAERLEVDARSVRRYVTMLQDLGIPVTSERGRHGGYRLRPGFRLPPLMFTEDEALALTLALLAARQLGVAGAAPAFEGALAKVDRVLPAAVRDEVRAVQEALVIDVPRADAPPAPDVVLAFSAAARDRRRLRIRHRSGRHETTREVDTYGLVYRTQRWYAVGWCHLRSDVRVFRLDRVLEVRSVDATFERPEGFDVRAHLISTLASTWTGWTAEVLLHIPFDEAARHVSPIVGTLEETPSGVLLRTQADTLDWVARYLVGLPCRFTVQEPPELIDALRRQRARIDTCVRDSVEAVGSVAGR
ncbi:MAG TPA: YafY family protein [Candidatus Dormibacteraeota bacterium]|nr:YafY family protein [Candidatus Dormibacteraeota bacterium]